MPETLPALPGDGPLPARTPAPNEVRLYELSFLQRRFERFRARVRIFAKQSDLDEFDGLSDENLDAMLEEIVAQTLQNTQTLASLTDNDFMLYLQLFVHKAVIELCYEGAVHNAKWFTMSAQSQSITKEVRVSNYLQIIGSLEGKVASEMSRLALDMPINQILEGNFVRQRPGRSDIVGSGFGAGSFTRP